MIIAEGGPEGVFLSAQLDARCHGTKGSLKIVTSAGITPGKYRGKPRAGKNPEQERHVDSK
jgi:hypothetical protein